MKLIFCKKCGDVVALRRKSRTCSCGKSGGHYVEKGKAAEIYGEVVPLGFDNSSFMSALQNQPLYGPGREFTAFVIEENCPSIKALPQRPATGATQELHSLEGLETLEKMLKVLLDHWALSPSDRRELLPFGKIAEELLNPGHLNLTDFLDRAGYLLSIHKALRILYPHNPGLRYSWVNHPNTDFNGRSPLDVMKDGMEGLKKVLSYLNSYREQ